MSSIQIFNLTKKYGEFQAISELSFDVQKNRVVGFLGPNGAGKTTAIRLIVGLAKPTSGKIMIGGKEVRFGDASTNHLFGYLPEQPSFYNWMTGNEFLNFIGEVFALEKRERTARIDHLLGVVNLKEARNKKIGTYSNGMKQRLGIAQALINNPKILIMDEPVSALDPIGRREVLSVIENLKKEMTIFLSTHVLSDVDRICDDVIIINKGKLVVNSSLSELKAKYATQILEIEFAEDPDKIIGMIQSENWAKKIEKNGNHLKIWISSEEILSQNIPLKFFAKQSLGVLSYGLVLPEVEDLFIALLEEK